MIRYHTVEKDGLKYRIPLCFGSCEAMSRWYHDAAARVVIQMRKTSKVYPPLIWGHEIAARVKVELLLYYTKW